MPGFFYPDSEKEINEHNDQERERFENEVEECDHLVGTYWTDHIGNGWLNQSEVDKGDLDDYTKHHQGFEFHKFNFCPKCGVKLES